MARVRDLEGDYIISCLETWLHGNVLSLHLCDIILYFYYLCIYS